MREREQGDGIQMARKQRQNTEGKDRASEASKGEAKDKVRGDENKRWYIKTSRYTI